tara:strand:- start:34885 stop:35463 length:579 start_codon:yes stop_codon:yes gene_type:complete
MSISVLAPEITPAEDLLALKGEGKPLGRDASFELQQWLYREARLLDQDRFREWYDMLDASLRYWCPLRENRFRRDKRPELSPQSCAMFDETKETIDLRLGRLESGMVWSEDPPTRHVYAITNIEAFETQDPEVTEVHSVFTLYRNRSERDQSTLMGRRADIWIKSKDGFRLKGRLIVLQQSTLLCKNLSYFF